MVSAIYLKRFLRDVLIVNNGKPRAAWIPKTHNLMGFPEGISGKSILLRLNRAIADLGVPKVAGEAKIKRYRGSGFLVTIGKEEYRAKTVILATGIEDNQPDVENYASLRNLGLLR